MNTLIPKSAMALTVAAALLGHSFLANADRREGTTVVAVAVPTITVSYRELDITKPAGLEVLYSRIQIAARSVCQLDDSFRNLARAHAARSCYRTAVEDAVRQINRPTLTALHRAKTRDTLG